VESGNDETDTTPTDFYLCQLFTDLLQETAVMDFGLY